MAISLKLLYFPEFGRALLGVEDEGIALLDTPVAEALVRALQESLPIAAMQRASIYVDQVQVAWGFIPGVHDHLDFRLRGQEKSGRAMLRPLSSRS
jgi:hypothetical protein